MNADWRFYAEAARDGCEVLVGRLPDAIRIAVLSRRLFRLQFGHDIAYDNAGNPIAVPKPRYRFPGMP